jgi:hypothetical protein
MDNPNSYLMKTVLLILMIAGAALSADGQYRKEAQASQDALVGKKEWISPPLPMEGSRIVYTETVGPGAVSKDQLFNNALEWYHYNYKSADTRLSVENREKGLISGTGVVRYNPSAAGIEKDFPIFFSFDLRVEDGEYTYRIYDIYGSDATGRFEYADMYLEDRNTSGQMKQRWEKRYRYEMLSDMNTMIEMAIVHLQQEMQKDPDLANN